MQQINEEILQIISNETKGLINDMNIVTPTIYTEIFLKFALLHNVGIADEHTVTDYFLSKKISLFTDLQDTAAKNAKRLSENTDKALSALQDRNESILKEVLEETKNLQQEIERLKKSVYKDELTGAFNRKWLHDYCLEEESQKFKSFGTLAIIDLNYFKAINDTYGHIIGDKVLIYIANQLKKTNESVIRYGGDEFIVIFSSKTTKKDAYNKLHEIREDIIKKHLKVKESSFKVSFSFGIHEFKQNDILTDVVELADSNMYEDKVEIKKRVVGIS